MKSVSVTTYAKQTGVARATVMRAIEEGKLSYWQTEKGQYKINVADEKPQPDNKQQLNSIEQKLDRLMKHLGL